MKKGHPKRIIILFFLFKVFFFYCQTHSNEKDYYKWFDEIIGYENTGLYDGLEYKKDYRTINKNHNYFITNKFLTGNIIYDGQSYYDIKIKYNIYNDELIVKLPIQSGYSIIKLISEKVERFSINNHQFIRLSENNNSSSIKNISGFYEITFQSKFLFFLKKYKKSKKKQLEKKFIYSEFKDNNEYFLYYNNEYYKIKSKKDLIKLFPKQKKDINTFYNTNRISLKSNSDIFMKRLMKHLNSLINTTINQ